MIQIKTLLLSRIDKSPGISGMLSKVKQLKYSIPHILTLINASCGFLAIIKSIEGDIVTAAYYILVAAVLDGCDGRLARALNCSSTFGGELDSLADAMSFCSAPMVLMYCWMPEKWMFGVSCFLSLYVCAGLWRLAKFNTFMSDKNHFIGLPTTVAASTLALLILYEPWMVLHADAVLRAPCLIALVMMLGYLMMSPIIFTKLNRYKCARIRDKVCVGTIFIMCAAAHITGFPLLFFLLVFYILLSVILFVRQFLIGKYSL
ncbi:MAG: CDP-alcohol phosphatidyltransferase family protein [Candidatus Dependentiae bacterium]|nr:CDP-alcohol phosphatidyltransferase family protein [Candidatus Dependentiae bacterium]